MHLQKRVNDSVHWYMSALTSRIVAQSGIPTDRFHLGKIVLQSLKDYPDHILQIDGAVDKSETSGSVLKRSVQCSLALRALGLQKGDVMILMAPNHIDLMIPYYAALYLGVIVAPIDKDLTVAELQHSFNVVKPKAVFCQCEKADDVQQALKETHTEAHIITFDEGDNYRNFNELLHEFRDEKMIEGFRPTEIKNPEETIAFLVPTSGTTGIPKAAAITHQNFGSTCHYFWARYSVFPTPSRMNLMTSPLQWMSGILMYYLSPVFRTTLLQSSLPLSREHTRDLICRYKPTFMMTSPTMITTIIKPGKGPVCDFSSFEFIILAGSAVSPELIDDVKKLTPNTDVFPLYGSSEMTTMPFWPENVPPGAYGRPVGHIQLRITDVDTEEDIVEANKTGELWVKGPSIFKGYYNDPEATKATFSADGWLKSGDMFYRDENGVFYFVERIKSLLKYRNHQVSPVEVESVIHRHPGVLDVAVIGVPDRECGDLIVACVVRREGHRVTAQEIKDLVKNSLTETKHLSGGVVFLNELPMTASTKIHRRKLKEIVQMMKRE